eukprot:COSAG01_NODE_2515_length_7529_cov_77.394347_3_plen_250_part_00
MDFQYEWESQPNRFHLQWLNVPAYWIDTKPVTQGAFAEYLQKNPSALSSDRYHYLKNWNWEKSGQSPKPHAGNETLPVTYVGLAEARAYCEAVGKRLPREEEWQFAATGGGDDRRPYPWGDDAPVEGKHIPKQHSGTVFPGPEPVGTHPAGASPFGVEDMTGSVWQMTDECALHIYLYSFVFEHVVFAHNWSRVHTCLCVADRDSHTRSVSLRGGSNYRPTSSMWYFPQISTNCATGICGVTTNQLHNK